MHYVGQNRPIWSSFNGNCLSTFQVSRRHFREHYKWFKMHESKQVSHFELCIPLFIDCIEPCHNNMESFFKLNQPILWWQWCWWQVIVDVNHLKLVTNINCIQHSSSKNYLPDTKLEVCKWGLYSRWSSCLYCPLRNSDQMTIGTTHPTLYWENQKSDSELNDPRMFCFHKLWNAHGECVKGDVKNLKCLSKASFQTKAEPDALERHLVSNNLKTLLRYIMMQWIAF